MTNTVKLPTKVLAMPQNRRENLAREIQLAIDTVEYADRFYWTSTAGQVAVRDLLQCNFLDSLVFCHNLICKMTGEDQLTTPAQATFNPNWRKAHLAEMKHQLNEARYLGSTDYIMDMRDEYRIPAVQGLFRATLMLRGIIDDFTKKDPA